MNEIWTEEDPISMVWWFIFFYWTEVNKRSEWDTSLPDVSVGILQSKYKNVAFLSFYYLLEMY